MTSSDPKRRKTTFDDLGANFHRVASIRKTFQEVDSLLQQLQIEDIELLADQHQRHHSGSLNELEDSIVGWLAARLSMEGLEALRCCHHLLPEGRFELIDR